jgi:hypothetical protein
MKGNCNYQPPAQTNYGNTGGGQVNFLLERNDKTDAIGAITESWDYEVAEVTDFKRNTVITAIIRERYSADAVEAIINNHLTGEDAGEFAKLQNWRNLAKAVADGKYLKTDLQETMSAEVIDRLTEIDETLQAVAETLIEKGITP